MASKKSKTSEAPVKKTASQKAAAEKANTSTALPKKQAEAVKKEQQQVKQGPVGIDYTDRAQQKKDEDAYRAQAAKDFNKQ